MQKQSKAFLRSVPLRSRSHVITDIIVGKCIKSICAYLTSLGLPVLWGGPALCNGFLLAVYLGLSRTRFRNYRATSFFRKCLSPYNPVTLDAGTHGAGKTMLTMLSDTS